jgi:hypothetical protein
MTKIKTAAVTLALTAPMFLPAMADAFSYGKG